MQQREPVYAPRESANATRAEPAPGRAAPLARAIPEPIAARIHQGKGAGVPLSAPVKETVESHLGHDLGGVRVKHDSEAGDLCQSLGARAFTHGADIWVGRHESPGD